MTTTLVQNGLRYYRDTREFLLDLDPPAGLVTATVAAANVLSRVVGTGGFSETLGTLKSRIQPDLISRVTDAVADATFSYDSATMTFSFADNDLRNRALTILGDLSEGVTNLVYPLTIDVAGAEIEFTAAGTDEQLVITATAGGTDIVITQTGTGTPTITGTLPATGDITGIAKGDIEFNLSDILGTDASLSALDDFLDELDIEETVSNAAQAYTAFRTNNKLRIRLGGTNQELSTLTIAREISLKASDLLESISASEVEGKVRLALKLLKDLATEVDIYETFRDSAGVLSSADAAITYLQQGGEHRFTFPSERIRDLALRLFAATPSTVGSRVAQIRDQITLTLGNPTLFTLSPTSSSNVLEIISEPGNANIVVRQIEKATGLAVATAPSIIGGTIPASTSFSEVVNSITLVQTFIQSNPILELATNANLTQTLRTSLAPAIEAVANQVNGLPSVTTIGRGTETVIENSGNLILDPRHVRVSQFTMNFTAQKNIVRTSSGILKFSTNTSSAKVAQMTLVALSEDDRNYLRAVLHAGYYNNNTIEVDLPPEYYRYTGTLDPSQTVIEIRNTSRAPNGTPAGSNIINIGERLAIAALPSSALYQGMMLQIGDSPVMYTVNSYFPTSIGSFNAGDALIYPFLTDRVEAGTTLRYATRRSSARDSTVNNRESNMRFRGYITNDISESFRASNDDFMSVQVILEEDRSNN